MKVGGGTVGGVSGAHKAIWTLFSEEITMPTEAFNGMKEALIAAGAGSSKLSIEGLCVRVLPRVII